MSCLAMVALTHLFHLRACDVEFLPIGYVDNWAILLNNPALMQKACDAVDQFADMLQIQVDARKCFTWAADRHSRHQLRSGGFRVVNAVWDLGAHVVYTRQLFNFTTLDRTRGLQDFWQKLFAATCTFKQKASLILRVAWPRAFHAVSAVVVGRKRFDALRTAVMQALSLSKPGANPLLQCSVQALAFDLQVYAILETVRDARSLGVLAGGSLAYRFGLGVRPSW